jgi:hypothetical protein
MAELPCQNPNCNSYGQPHPNCRCYLGMAKGGKAKNFCSTKKPHDKDCQYFAQGGFAIPQGFTEVPQQANDQDNNAPPQNTTPQFSIPAGSKEITQNDEPAPPTPPPGFEPVEQAYSTPGQQLLTAGEGVAQGVPFLGPVATAAELGLSKLGVPNLSAEDIKERAETNPTEHNLGQAAGLIGGMYSGLGEAGLASSLGAAALKGAGMAMARQTGDEATNLLLNQDDPQSPVAAALTNIGYAGLTGGLGSSLGFKIGSKLSDLAKQNIGEKVTPFLEGVQSAASGNKLNPAAEEAGMGLKLAGENFYNNLASHVPGILGGIAGGLGGYENYGILGGIAGGLGGAATAEYTKGLTDVFTKPLFDKIGSAIGKNAVAPLLTHVISSGTADGLGDAIDWASNVNRGYNKIQSAVDSLFNIGPAVATQQMTNQQIENNRRDKIKEYLDNGGLDQNIKKTIEDTSQPPKKYAKGGEVNPLKPANNNIQPLIKDQDGMNIHFPEASQALMGAKFRINNYLMNLKPNKNPQRLPFDDAMVDPQHERSFDRAIDIANNPLKILHEVKKGTLDPQDVQHFQTMFPDVNNILQKKITQKILEKQFDNKKPPYHVRQGLSLLLGSPLSSDVTAGNIQAAQAIFNPQPPPQQQGQALPKSKKGSAALGKLGSAYRTDEQSRDERSQKS